MCKWQISRWLRNIQSKRSTHLLIVCFVGFCPEVDWVRFQLRLQKEKCWCWWGEIGQWQQKIRTKLKLCNCYGCRESDTPIIKFNTSVKSALYSPCTQPIVRLINFVNSVLDHISFTTYQECLLNGIKVCVFLVSEVCTWYLEGNKGRKKTRKDLI